MSEKPPAPRRDIIRMQHAAAAIVDDDGAPVHLPPMVVRDADGDSAVRSKVGTLVGYPIVFNAWTRIDNFLEGLFLERVMPEAVTDSLAKRGDRMKVLFNHGMDPTNGALPLGRPAVQRIEKRGFYAEVPLSDTDFNRDLAELIRDGAITGQSFRADIPTESDEEWHYPSRSNARNPEMLPERSIHRLALNEYGPVTFEAYETTTVGLRSAVEYVAWNGGDDDLRARMLRAIGFDDPHRVLQRLSTGTRPVQPGHKPPAGRDTDSDVTGAPGHRSRDERRLWRQEQLARILGRPHTRPEAIDAGEPAR